MPGKANRSVCRFGSRRRSRVDDAGAALNGVVAFAASAAVASCWRSQSINLLGPCAIAAVAAVLIIIWLTDRKAMRRRLSIVCHLRGALGSSTAGSMSR